MARFAMKCCNQSISERWFKQAVHPLHTHHRPYTDTAHCHRGAYEKHAAIVSEAYLRQALRIKKVGHILVEQAPASGPAVDQFKRRGGPDEADNTAQRDEAAMVALRDYASTVFAVQILRRHCRGARDRQPWKFDGPRDVNLCASKLDKGA